MVEERRDVVRQVIPRKRSRMDRTTAAAKVRREQSVARSEATHAKHRCTVVRKTAMDKHDGVPATRFDGEEPCASAVEPNLARRLL